MATPRLTILPENPDFLDLPWDKPLATWEVDNIVELPRGVHRHVVRFVAYGAAVYAIKELPLAFARNEFAALRELQRREASVVEVAGIVERSWVDPTEEWSAAVITRYLDFAFSYRELISGQGSADVATSCLTALRACWSNCICSVVTGVIVLYRTCCIGTTQPHSTSRWSTPRPQSYTSACPTDNGGRISR